MNMKKIALTTALTLSSIVLGGQAASAQDAASEMVNPEDKVLVGYWHSWQSSGNDGYQRGSSATMDLSEVPEGYNVVDVSFMKAHSDGAIPTFKPQGMTDEQFRAEVAELNAEGRTVILALGGADAHIELTKEDEDAFVAEIIRLVDTYGFDGIDIDLEQSAIQAGDNQTVIPSALRKVKDHYRAQGENFMITMAPEFPYLSENGAYAPYIKGLEGYYDFINPQFYNQGGDGFWSNDLNMWISQSDDAHKEEFLYGLTTRLVTGTDGWIHIPADKFVIGIPSNNDAAATGFVKDPKAVANTLDRLEADGNEIKGLMTWSVNWDAGKDAKGNSYNNQFVTTYAPIVFDGETPTTPAPDTQAPTAPSTLRASTTTQTSTTLNWTASTDNVGVKEYQIFRNGTKIATTKTTSFTNTGLTPNTTYTYEVKAIDDAGNLSKASNAITVKTSEETVVVTPTPNKPTGLKTGTVTDSSIALSWSPVTNTEIKEYIVYRDGKEIKRTVNTNLTDTNLTDNTSYSYQVAAVSKDNKVSEKSATVTAKTTQTIVDPGTPGEIANWDKNKVYNTGDKVVYNGRTYEAKYWTQGNQPDTSDAWKQIAGELPEWNKDKAYNGGERVTYNGHTYEAKWWTQGNNPETSDVWVKK